MNAIVPVTPAPRPSFRFEDIDFRTIEHEGEIAFHATDLARVLGYRDASNLTRNLDADETTTHIVRGGFGEDREVTYVTQPGVFRALMLRRGMTKLPDATRLRISKFQRWVTHEVLPSIHRTGAYAVPSAPAPTAVNLIEALRDPATVLALLAHHAGETLSARAETQAEREAHSETHAALEDEARLRRIESARAETNGRALVVVQAQVKELAPLAQAYREVLDAEGGLCVTDTANILGVPRGRLFAFMRDKGSDDAPLEPWLYVRPGQAHEHAYRPRLHRGEMIHRVYPIRHNTRPVELKPQPLVTMRGLDRLRVEYPLWAAEQERKAERQGRLPGVG